MANNMPDTAPTQDIPTYENTRGLSHCVAFFRHGQGWLTRFPQFDDTCAHWTDGPFDDRNHAEAYAARCNNASDVEAQDVQAPGQQVSTAEAVLARIYGHIADRVAEHYHLPLTPQMWADWNAAIHNRTDDVMFVSLRLTGVTVWRVWHGSTPVFVLYRAGMIRTALSLLGSYVFDAKEEARKLGQTALGNELKPVEASKRLTLEELREQDGLREVRELAKRQSQRLASLAENERREKEKLLSREERIQLHKDAENKNRIIKKKKLLAHSIKMEHERSEKQRRKIEKANNELYIQEAYSYWDDDGGSIKLVSCLRYYASRFLNEDDELYSGAQRGSKKPVDN